MLRGEIEKIYVGPMFGRKSSRLIKRVQMLREFGQKRVIVIKPDKDTRSATSFIEDHEGGKLEAYEVEADVPQSIPSFIASVEAKEGKRFDYVALDEVQFFSLELISTVRKLLDLGYNVIAAGLNFDFTGMPFGPTLGLVGLCMNSSQIEICYSYCKRCGNDAIFSQRISDTTDQVEPGNHYEPRCGEHFTPPKSTTSPA